MNCIMTKDQGPSDETFADVTTLRSTILRTLKTCYRKRDFTKRIDGIINNIPLT